MDKIELSMTTIKALLGAHDQEKLKDELKELSKKEKEIFNKDIVTIIKAIAEVL